MMAGMITFALTTFLVKTSILCMYHRIFGTNIRTPIIILVSCNTLWLLSTIYFDVFQCRPFDAAFDVNLIFSDRCEDLQAFYYSMASLNLVLDLLHFGLFVYAISPVQTTGRKKVVSSLCLSISLMYVGVRSDDDLHSDHDRPIIAAVMRIVAIGNLREEDVTGKFARTRSNSLFTADPSSGHGARIHVESDRTSNGNYLL